MESIKDVDIKKPPVALSGIDVRDIKSGIYKRRWDLKYITDRLMQRRLIDETEYLNLVRLAKEM